MRASTGLARLGAVGAGLSLAAAGAFGDATIQDLGTLPDGRRAGVAYAVSDSGTVASGIASAESSNLAFRWTVAGGAQSLGDLSGGDVDSRGYGMSRDGTTVLGLASSGFTEQQAFRWTVTGATLEALGWLGSGALQYSFSSDATTSGSTVVGQSVSSGGYEAFYWTQAGGMVALADLSGGSLLSAAWGINPAGTVVVGQGTSSSGSQAVRWDKSGGSYSITNLGDLSGGSVSAIAFDLSSNGSYIVGKGTSASGPEAFRWTALGGMVGLGDLSGGDFHSEAWGVSDNGAVVVGWSLTANDREAFIWDPTNGMRRLQDVLDDLGADLSDWSKLERALDVSGDGKVIVGEGILEEGGSAAFLATLD